MTKGKNKYSSGLLLRHKILFIAVLGSVGFLLYLLFNYFTVSDNRARIIDIRDAKVPILELTAQLKGEIANIRSLLTSAITEEDPEMVEEAAVIHGKILKLLQDMLSMAPQAEGEIADLNKKYLAYYELAHSISLSMAEQSSELEKVQDKIAKIVENLETLQKGIQQFRDTNFKNLIVALDDADKAGNEAIQTGMVGGTLMIIALFVIAWFIAGWVIESINRVSSSLAEMAVGKADLTLRLKSETNDEVRGLVAHFNEFIVRLQETLKQNTLASAVINQGISELYVESKEAKKVMHQQKADIDNIVSAMEQLRAASDEVVNNAGDAAQQTKSALEESQRNRKAVLDNKETMLKLFDEIETACEVINRLAVETERIGSASDVIRSVAEQTNLLALNAAIEAARAGEQGRGFAVVADEVRNLASRTAESTQEIYQIMAVIQKGAQQAVEVMEGSKEYTHIGVELANQNVGSLEAVNISVEAIQKYNSIVTSSTEEQSLVISQISNSVKKVQQVSNKMVEINDKMELSSRSISLQADKLQHQIDGFKF